MAVFVNVIGVSAVRDKSVTEKRVASARDRSEACVSGDESRVCVCGGDGSSFSFAIYLAE